MIPQISQRERREFEVIDNIFMLSPKGHLRSIGNERRQHHRLANQGGERRRYGSLY